MVVRWSYKTVHFGLKKDGLLGGAFLDDAEIEETLNEYGQGGWDLVSMFETRDGVIAVFKQPLDLDYTELPGLDSGRKADIDQKGGRQQFVPRKVSMVAEPEDEPEPVKAAVKEKKGYPVVNTYPASRHRHEEEEEVDTDMGIGSIRIE